MTTQSDIEITEEIARPLSHLEDLELRENESLSAHTSFGVGGAADLLALPSSTDALCRAIAIAHRAGVQPVFLGNGTNLIVRDGGIRGLVIRVAGEMGRIEIEGTRAIVEAGAPLASVCHRCACEGLSGLEFAAGIPGTIGGALIMNAGANGGEIGDVTEWVEVANAEGHVERITCDGLAFGYRRSPLREMGAGIVRAGLRLKRGDAGRVHAKLCEKMEERCSKQPVSSPSAGSIFKRPDGDYAGRLLDEAKAKGMRVGGAAVSDKHANFMVNLGGATAADVIDLIDAARELVYEKFGVMLEPEVCVVGEDE
jgi:UDP-N-acetylmuramate dehydrogenase